MSPAAYATAWLAERQLKPRTAAHYRTLLDRFVVPAIGTMRISTLTPGIIRTWHAALDPTGYLGSTGRFIDRALADFARLDRVAPPASLLPLGEGQDTSA